MPTLGSRREGKPRRPSFLGHPGRDVRDNRQSGENTMKAQTQIKAGSGGLATNHNQTLVRPAPIRIPNHNQTLVRQS
jgi:hypothetical protein